jgi:nucleotide-binding universal stress UspA family protein
MIREVFVPLLEARSDAAALEAAIALARGTGAHVSALVTLDHPLPLVTEFGYVPVEMSQQQVEMAREQARAQVRQAEVRLAHEDVSSEVRLSDVVVLWSEETAAWQARHADLSVLAAGDGDAGTRFGLTFRALLQRSGRPVLLVPDGATVVVPAARATLAWTPTPEAARAVHDALPLLAPGAEVDLLVVDPQVASLGHGEEPGADIARHLARHGLRVRGVQAPAAGRSIGEAIVLHAAQSGAQLLAMGGYGHRRWREFLLGGTTRTVLAQARLPVLFSH